MNVDGDISAQHAAQPLEFPLIVHKRRQIIIEIETFTLDFTKFGLVYSLKEK